MQWGRQVLGRPGWLAADSHAMVPAAAVPRGVQGSGRAGPEAKGSPGGGEGFGGEDRRGGEGWIECRHVILRCDDGCRPCFMVVAGFVPAALASDSTSMGWECIWGWTLIFECTNAGVVS